MSVTHSKTVWLTRIFPLKFFCCSFESYHFLKITRRKCQKNNSISWLPSWSFGGHVGLTMGSFITKWTIDAPTDWTNSFSLARPWNAARLGETEWNVLKSDLKKSCFIPFEAYLTHFWTKSDTPGPIEFFVFVFSLLFLFFYCYYYYYFFYDHPFKFWRIFRKKENKKPKWLFIWFIFLYFVENY